MAIIVVIVVIVVVMVVMIVVIVFVFVVAFVACCLSWLFVVRLLLFERQLDGVDYLVGDTSFPNL